MKQGGKSFGLWALCGGQTTQYDFCISDSSSKLNKVQILGKFKQIYKEKKSQLTHHLIKSWEQSGCLNST